MEIEADAFDGSDPLIVCRAGGADVRFTDACKLKRFAD